MKGVAVIGVVIFAIAIVVVAAYLLYVERVNSKKEIEDVKANKRKR